MVSPVKTGWMGTSRTGHAGGLSKRGRRKPFRAALDSTRRTLPSEVMPTRHKTRWQALLTHRRVKASAGTVSVGVGAIQKPEAPKPARVEKLAALQRSQRRRSAGRSLSCSRWKVQKMHRIKARKRSEADPIKQRLDACHSSKTAT